MDAHPLTLTTGRRLSWTAQGAADGRPVLSLHGSPGSRLSRYADPHHLVAAGIRQITYDRPGYGLSDPQPGRTVADVVGDVVAVLDAAGVARAGIIGGSGGGPHALALAALLPDRCTVVHCRVGLAPYDRPELDFFAGMDAENQRRFRAAALDRSTAVEVLGQDLDALCLRSTQDPDRLMGAMEVPESDRVVLRRIGRQLAATVAESARQGAVGLADDFRAFTSPWGFEVGEVRAPVVLSYGLHDVNVPAGHGAWLAEHVRCTEVRVDDSGGHLVAPEEELALLQEVAAA